MSIESAKSFVKRMKSDEEFAKKVNEFKSMEEAQRYVTSQGFNFTVEELRECQHELDDDELASVVAAKGAYPYCEVGSVYDWYPNCQSETLTFV